jgi:hypothetical protein
MPSSRPNPSPPSKRRHAADEVDFSGFKRIRIVSTESRDKPHVVFEQLLYDCLDGAPNHTMSLKDIYEWMLQHSEKARDLAGPGWRNEVRHNLSMNAVSPRRCAIVYYLHCT